MLDKTKKSIQRGVIFSADFWSRLYHIRSIDMTYSSTNNNQNQTGTNSYQIVDRLNYAALEQNYQPHQIEQFKSSAIDPELVLLNITNLEGDLAVSAVLWGLSPTDRTNTGVARERFTRPLQHIRQGGLAFYGVDPLTGERTECLSFKPDRPIPQIVSTKIPAKFPPKPSIPPSPTGFGKW
jgi:hypothetical protein